MKRKVLIFCVLMLAASISQAAMIQSISTTTAVTTFVSIGGSGTLSMVGIGGINVQDVSNAVTTYPGGSFSLISMLTSDASAGGIASGNFAGGAFSYNDSANNPLLSGSILSLNLTEASNGSGVFVGSGTFNVIGGSLQGSFGVAGSIVGISFSVNPITIANFSTSFNASSNVTILPTQIPEPATLALLVPAIMALRRKRK